MPQMGAPLRPCVRQRPNAAHTPGSRKDNVPQTLAHWRARGLEWCFSAILSWQESGPWGISSAKEVEPVKNDKLPIIHCEYAQGGQDLAQLLEESFRLYLRRMLADAACTAASS